MSLLHLYRKPALSLSNKNDLLSIIKQRVSPEIRDLETEYCFNIETTAPLTNEELNTLRWLLAETFEPENFFSESFLINNPPAPPLSKGGKGGFCGSTRGQHVNLFKSFSIDFFSVLYYF